MSVVQSHPSDTTTRRVVESRSRILPAKSTVYTASPMWSDGKQFKGLSYALEDSKHEIGHHGRGPRPVDRQQQEANEPCAGHGHESGHVSPQIGSCARHPGKRDQQEVQDWYAQIQRGLKSIARSSADSGNVRGLNSRKRCKVKYGTQKNTVSTTISAVFTFHMDSITRPTPCRTDEPAGQQQTARTRESS